MSVFVGGLNDGERLDVHNCEACSLYERKSMPVLSRKIEFDPNAVIRITTYRRRLLECYGQRFHFYAPHDVSDADAIKKLIEGYHAPDASKGGRA